MKLLRSGIEEETNREYFEWDSYVVTFPNNESPHTIGKDGGEPEDQKLFRDWNWIVPALNAAFEDGKRIGRILGTGKFTKEFANG